MKRLFITIACLFSLASASPALAGASGLAVQVAQRNPELAALSARIEEARARVGPAGTWADPRVTLEVMDAPTLAGPRATVMQMIPLLGQPGLMAEMARLEVSMREAEWADRRLMLTADAAQALIELAYVRRTEAIIAANRDLADRMARVSEAKYAVGKGMQADVLRAHLAKTRLLEPSIPLEARRASAQASFGAIAPGLVAPTVTLRPPTKLPGLESLWAHAERESPMLRMRRLAVEHAKVGLELARRERIPDVELGLTAGKSMPGDMPFAGGMASVALPIWWQSKQVQRVVAAEQQLESQRQALEASRKVLRARIEGAYAQAQAASAQLGLYQGGLLAQTRQTFQASLAAYQVNQGDFLMMLDAQMALNDIQMAEAMALTERLKMDAMLDALVGREPLQEAQP
jgi:outer membrane protein TolC